MFFDNWASQKGEELPERDYFPELASAGDKPVRVLRGEPGSNLEIFKAYLLAIRQAKTSIHIASAYFVPDAQIMGALVAAAGRGVDVKVILPSVSDNWLTSRGANSYYDQMLKAGIRVFELKEAVLHAKTAVIDGTWSTVGSTNLDVRSFLHNKEVNVVVMGAAFGGEMEAAFQEDLKGSREITRAEWDQRPRSRRVGEWFARLFAYWL
jgi:cardiolipin synthase